MGEPEAKDRVCVWRTCALAGQPTADQRCPKCGTPTEPASNFSGVALGGAADRLVDATLRARPMIVTTNELPLHRITAVHGNVFGLVVMSRDYLGNLGAGLRTYVGGEIPQYTALLVDSRNQARDRLWAEAIDLGANAVVAFRFDCNEIGNIMTEVAAYGTAVTVERIRPEQSPPPAPVIEPSTGT